jgi:hypothetical protein
MYYFIFNIKHILVFDNTISELGYVYLYFIKYLATFSKIQMAKNLLSHNFTRIAGQNEIKQLKQHIWLLLIVSYDFPWRQAERSVLLVATRVPQK